MTDATEPTQASGPEDPDWPSGPWIGFYNYVASGTRYRQELTLEFQDGLMRGDGHDDVGQFLIRGRYDGADREAWWVKTYPGSHDVHYHGFREVRGIWGTWSIPGDSHGGFHIWPKGHGDALSLAVTTEIEEPAPALAPQTPGSPDEE